MLNVMRMAYSQVCSVLESLEQEYRRDDDWCGAHDKLGSSAEMDHVLPLISKHLEQKEAFLKVTTELNWTELISQVFYQCQSRWS